MKIKQIIALVVVVALLMAGSVLATFAYLTSQDSVTNVFTVGNIQMKLDEKLVDKNGVPQKNDQGEELRTSDRNEYHLMPGHIYEKDPKVTVLANSEECYVRMMVEVSNYDALKAAFPIDKYPQYYMTVNEQTFFALQGLVDGYDAATWNCVGLEVADGTENRSAVYEFRYKTTVKKSETDTELAPLFTKVVIPGGIDNAALQLINNLEIMVTAHAIQVDGFASADLAWGNFNP